MTIKQKRPYVVFSKRIASQLVDLGFQLVGTAPDKANPRYNVFYFRFSEDLLDAIEALK